MIVLSKELSDSMVSDVRNVITQYEFDNRLECLQKSFYKRHKLHLELWRTFCNVSRQCCCYCLDEGCILLVFCDEQCITPLFLSFHAFIGISAKAVSIQSLISIVYFPIIQDFRYNNGK